jgi:O-antigen/teichoic acid export membrane protein
MSWTATAEAPRLARRAAEEQTARETAASTAAVVVARLARAGFIFLAARALGHQGFGDLAVGLSMVGLAAHGLETTRRTVVRFGRRYLRARDARRFSTLILAARALACLAAAGGCAALAVLAWRSARASGDGTQGAAAIAVLAAAPVALVVREALRARRALRYDRGRIVLRLALEPVTQLALAALAAAFLGPQPVAFAVAYVLGIAAAAVERAIGARRATRAAAETLSSEEGGEPDDGAGATSGARDWTLYAAATSVGPVAGTAAMHLTVIATAAVLGPWAAGLIRLAHQVVDVGALLPNALRRATLLGLDPEVEGEASLQLAGVARRRSLLAAVPLLGGVAALAWPIADFVGGGPGPSLAHAIALLAVATLVALGLGPTDPVLRRIGTPEALGAVIGACAASVVLAPVLALALAPALGVTGVAGALATALVLREAALATAVRRCRHRRGEAEKPAEDV